MSRILPLEPPYAPEVGAQLESMMPAGVPPIALFRMFVRNLPMASAMWGWGGYELSRRLSLSMREREIVIDRTCVRCGAEYEWGVHVMYYAERVDLTPEQVHSLTHGAAADPCWTEPRERLLIRAVDALCDHHDVDDALWAELARGLHGRRTAGPDRDVRAGTTRSVSWRGSPAYLMNRVPRALRRFKRGVRVAGAP